MRPEGHWLSRTLREQAALQPDAPALTDGTRTVTYGSLLDEVADRAWELSLRRPQCLAIALSNGVEWALWDLAAAVSGTPCVPLPGFFSPDQLDDAIEAAAIDSIVADGAGAGTAQRPGFQVCDGGGTVWLTRPAPARRVLPPGTSKITFTSGMTGRPKGVCLDDGLLMQVTSSLAGVCRNAGSRRHVCVLPLSTLLENVAGIYVSLVNGAHAILPTPGSLGFDGASRLDATRFVSTLASWQPESVILLPQLLLALVAAVEQGARSLPSLRFAAVGGGKVAASLLERAAAAGLPVFEGYALSECGSAVALNTPGASRIGAVGRPLPHVQVRIAPDGEVLVCGARFLGYLGEEPETREWLPTGDLGRIEDGFLTLAGRRRDMFVTAFGRNVNPEWAEAELTQQEAIAQAIVIGEARQHNVAVVVPRRPDPRDADIRIAVARANARLPDYARVHRWIPAAEAFTSANGLATANGRVRREAVAERYAVAIDAALSSPEPIAS